MSAATISSAYSGFPSERRRSEEHTSELQSHSDLACRLLLEKQKIAAAMPAADRDGAGRSAGRLAAASAPAVALPAQLPAGGRSLSTVGRSYDSARVRRPAHG